MEDTGQERSEDATDKRVTDQRERGNVARSKDLNLLITLLSGVLSLYCMNDYIFRTLKNLFINGLTVKKQYLFQDFDIGKYMLDLSSEIVVLFFPIFLFIAIAAVLGSTLIGGFNFSLSSVGFDINKLNPINGLKKIFSMNNVVEVIKSILKFIFVFITFLIMVRYEFFNIFNLDFYFLSEACSKSVHFIFLTWVMLSIPVAFLVLFDVPYQVWHFNQKLKMTKQEVRDEFKETEGKPEVKSKIRQLQKKMAKRRMMAKIKEADALIVNPEHYAVAIQYQESGNRAPIVVAKGIDLVAEMIKKVAKKHEVPVVSAPPLARSLYYFVELEEEVPSALYVAVAQILAYVYQLKRYEKGDVNLKPELPKEFPIPEPLQR